MLFEWNKQHKELVRSLPAPLKSVEIRFEHHSWQIKGIREDKWLKIYLANDGKKLGKMEFEINAQNQLVHRKGSTELSRDSFDSMLTCYCALMAFMVYEKPELAENKEPPAEIKKHGKRKVSSAKPKTVYLLRTRKTSAPSKGGHHASPKGIFTVRGHYRQYKSGKRIWVAEYKKGTGEKKSKTYKIGGK